MITSNLSVLANTTLDVPTEAMGAEEDADETRDRSWFNPRRAECIYLCNGCGIAGWPLLERDGPQTHPNLVPPCSGGV